VRDLMAKAQAEGILTTGRAPAFCKAIRTREFRDLNGIDEVSVEGPASKQSTTVVVYYRFRNFSEHVSAPDAQVSVEPPADPLLALSGILRGAIREGAAAFVRELRRDKDTRVEMRERRGRRSGREESAA
jgi:hypothetical protein